jgi:hypothetical protein
MDYTPNETTVLFVLNCRRAGTFLGSSSHAAAIDKEPSRGFRRLKDMLFVRNCNRTGTFHAAY